MYLLHESTGPRILKTQYWDLFARESAGSPSDQPGSLKLLGTYDAIHLRQIIFT